MLSLFLDKTQVYMIQIYNLYKVKRLIKIITETTGVLHDFISHPNSNSLYNGKATSKSL
jgi:hypothetical protein